MSNVVEARAVLQRAEDKEKEERRSKLIHDLAEVHKARTRAQAEYQRIAGQIKRERSLRHELRFKIEHVDGLLAQHNKNRPIVAEYLPADLESVQWMMDHTMMENARATLMNELRSVPDSMDVHAASFEGPFGTLALLENSERNLLNALDPAGRDVWLKGGIFAVGDM